MGRKTRKGDGRLEVARDKVWGRRDVVGVRDVYVSMCEGVFLRSAASGVMRVVYGGRGEGRG